MATSAAGIREFCGAMDNEARLTRPARYVYDTAA